MPQRGWLIYMPETNYTLPHLFWAIFITNDGANSSSLRDNLTAIWYVKYKEL